MVKSSARISPLTRKLLRDFKEGWKSFFAIWIICTLAITLYVGIDACWRGMEHNFEQQFDESHMADLWVEGAISDRTVRDLAAIEGVADVQRRVVAYADSQGLKGDPVVWLAMTDGPARINTARLVAGEPLPEARKDICVVQDRFAQTHGLSVGDTLNVKLNGQDFSLTIGALGTLGEFVVTMYDGEFSPDQYQFGYATVSPGTLGHLPYNQACLTLSPDADVARVKRAVQELMGDTQAVALLREDISSIKMAMDEAQQIRAMGQIFPLVFFIIAALITWTTMSRLVENQRMQIGTLFSQGYSRGQLIGHYASYGLVLAVLGVLSGLAGAYFGFAPVILNMLGTLYTLDGVKPFLLPGVVGLIGLVLAVITGGASMISARVALRENPAALLRPKPPKKGKRIVLENVGWIWNRLKFSSKMILRNLFRNPMRALMGIIGSLGCTAMMLTGFGMRDSVDFVLRNYYTTTMRYDAVAYLKRDAPRDYAQTIGLRAGAGAWEEKMVSNCEAFVDGQWQVKPVFVYEDAAEMVHLIDEEGERIRLPLEGVALTRKASEEYGLGVGDVLSLRNAGGRALTTTVTQVVDVQLGQGIYASRTAWRALDLTPWRPTAVTMVGEGLNLAAAADLEAVDRVRTLDEERNSNSQVLEVMNLVVLLLVVFSGALALVVLYNLGYLNFSERIRELATLMVLGFNPREIKHLVLRENLIIAFIGLPLGFLVGPQLHELVLKTGLPNTLEFVPYIRSVSWLFTGGFTVAFALLVNWMLGRKFKDVNMVEALKSIE